MKFQVATFNCIIKNDLGQVLSNTYHSNINMHSNQKRIDCQNLEKHLVQLTAGEIRKIYLNEKEAYGAFDTNKQMLYPRKNLSAQIKVGQKIGLVNKSQILQIYNIKEISHDEVLLDRNHPYAGQSLCFEFEIHAVRPSEDYDSENTSNLSNISYFQL